MVKMRAVVIAWAQSLLYVSYMDSVVIPSLLIGSYLAIAASVRTMLRDFVMSDEIGVVQPSPAVWLCLAHSTYSYIQLARCQVPDVVSGGKVGPVYIYRHPLLLR
jgi:hypothetical protein